jgi:hypothetical protein
MANGGPAHWKWVQVPSFAHPSHSEWDVIQWEIEDTLVRDPRKVSHPVNDPPDEWWYMVSKEAPGLHGLPNTIVLFRIDSEPSGDTPGVIEGWEAWWGDDLFETLMRRLRHDPAF